MIIEFNYGIEYKGFIFGWHKKELYRLPSTSGRYSYGFKKLNAIMVGNQLGYCLKRDKFSMKKLEEKTIIIPKQTISILKSEHLPF
jgi:hypothetical protein